MNNMLVRRLTETAKLPTKKPEDAGYDFYVDWIEPVMPWVGVPQEEFAHHCKSLSEWRLTPLITDAPVLPGTREPRVMTYKVHTGVALALPDGYWMLLKPRSGASVKYGLSVLAGVVDNGYRGEIIGVVQCSLDLVVKPGDRLFQGVLLPQTHRDIVDVDGLPESDRGAAGFGASGR